MRYPPGPLQQLVLAHGLARICSALQLNLEFDAQPVISAAKLSTRPPNFRKMHINVEVTETQLSFRIIDP
jgi:hypothetical protein